MRYDNTKKEIPSKYHTKVCKRYQAGDSLNTLARTYDTTAVVIRRVLVENSIEIRKTGALRNKNAEDNLQEIAKLYFELGKSMKFISQKFGIPEDTTWYRISRLRKLRAKEEGCSEEDIQKRVRELRKLSS